MLLKFINFSTDNTTYIFEDMDNPSIHYKLDKNIIPYGCKIGTIYNIEVKDPSVISKNVDNRNSDEINPEDLPFYDKGKHKNNRLGGETLYRYTSARYVLEMFENKSVYFMNINTMNDNTEGTLYKIKYSQDGHPVTINQQNTTFCQSWTSLSDSNAMWQIYNKKDSVRIRVNSKTYFDELYGAGKNTILSLFLDKISYLSPDEFDKYCKSGSILLHEYIADQTGEKWALPIFNKRDSYIHEKEVRYAFTGDEEYSLNSQKYYKMIKFDTPNIIKIIQDIVFAPDCCDDIYNYYKSIFNKKFNYEKIYISSQYKFDYTLDW